MAHECNLTLNCKLCSKKNCIVKIIKFGGPSCFPQTLAVTECEQERGPIAI